MILRLWTFTTILCQRGWMVCFHVLCGTNTMWTTATAQTIRLNHGMLGSTEWFVRRILTFVLVTHLKRENANTSTVINQAKLGFPPPPTRSKYDNLHRRVQKLYDSHRQGIITSTELLSQARHIIYVFE